MRLVDMRHRRLHLRIGADDHAITNARAMRRSAIYRDDAGAGLGTDRIRRETLAVGDVVDLDLFVLEDVGERSEEHTSELQSLMRISYAVFCLKKKNTNVKSKTRPISCLKLVTTQHSD